jgi:apolipoprotein N-acyltransferase
MLRVRLVPAILAGVAVGLSFEPFGLVVLLPLAVAVLTLLCRGVNARGGFLVGSVFGVAFLLTLLPWLRVIGTDAWLLLSAFEALFYGLLGLGTVLVQRLPGWPLWVAALWPAVEALRGSVPFGGFPWGRLAFAVVDTPLAPLIGYLGAAGVTFTVALVSTMLAWSVLHVPRAPGRALAVAVAALLLGSLGTWLPDAAPRAVDGPSTTVAAVQGNVPGEGMAAFAERRAVLDNHVEATLRLADDVAAGRVARPELVVWPESSTDIDPFVDPTVFADISTAVDAVGVPVLVGAMVGGEDPGDVFNQGIVWSPGTGPGERYAKRHPVPFGEYIPLRDLLSPYFQRLEQIPRDMVPGDTTGVLDLAGVRIGDVICFEVAYDALLRDVVRGGAQVLVVQTNNATYMGTGQVEQQFAISRLRAMETGRSVVVAATNGISGIVTPTGEVVERATPRTQQVLVRSVGLSTALTPAMRWGHLVEWVLVAGALAGAAAGMTARLASRRRRASDPGQRPRTPGRDGDGDDPDRPVDRPGKPVGVG